MWPEETFNLACKVQYIVLLACLFDRKLETPLEWGKMSVWAMDISKKNKFGPPRDVSCASLL